MIVCKMLYPLFPLNSYLPCFLSITFTYYLGKICSVISLITENLSPKVLCYIKLFPLRWSSWISNCHKNKKTPIELYMDT
jgi:hypothetical protein